MMSETNPKEHNIDPKEYGVFIKQIEFRDIWIQSASIENLHGPIMPEPGRISIVESARWEPVEEGFHAFHKYDVTLRGSDDDIVATVSAAFGLLFSSTQEMTDSLFEVFSDVNLPINSWPFFREYFYASLARMGWAPLTLPALKVGVEKDSDESN